MTTPEDEFAEIQRSHEQREADRRLQEELTQKYTAYLIEHGVDIDTPEAQVGILEIIVFKKLLSVGQLLTPNDPELLELKKQIQARFVLRDMDDVWLRLIDQEFPGESLQPGDHEVISTQFRVGLELSEQFESRHKDTQEKMFTHLRENGFDYFLEEDYNLLTLLIIYHNYKNLKPQDKFEKARLLLLDKGKMADPAWYSLLEKFFPFHE